MAEEMSDVPERLSPELVLVSPDLAMGARAALPERPWEVFVPPRPPAWSEFLPAAPVLTVVPDVEEELDLPAAPAPDDPVPAEVAVAVTAPTGTAAAAAAPASPHPIGQRVPGPASGSRAIALALFALAVVLAFTIRPVRDAPTFTLDEPGASTPPARSQDGGEAPGASSGSAAGPAKAPGAKGPSASSSGASKEPKASTRSAKPSSSSSANPSTAAKSKPKESKLADPVKSPVSRGPRPAPGGYVYGSELRLFVASGGTTIAWFQAVTPCGSNVMIQKIPIASDGTFTARRTVDQRGGRAVVELSGRVVARRQIHGNLSAKGPGCDRVRRYAAVLS